MCGNAVNIYKFDPYGGWEEWFYAEITDIMMVNKSILNIIRPSFKLVSMKFLQGFFVGDEYKLIA
jgi:hypothetical protein